MTESGALASFGELSGMSIPLINMPSTIIGSIALVLVPELSDNFYRHSDVTLKNNVEKAIKSSVFISCMIIPIFLSVGKELGTLVYHNQTAGIYVQRASIIMLPMSVTMITTSMLNSLNLERKTLLYYLVGASFLLLSIYFLPKYLGIYSLIIGLLLSYLTTSICNLILIKKTCNKKPKLSLFLIASVLIVIPSGLISYLLKGILLPFLPLGLTVLFCSVLAMLFSYALFSLFNLFSVKEDILK
jgi:stage V sporulation protein B